MRYLIALLPRTLLATVKARAEVAAEDAYRVAERMTKAETDRETAREDAAKLRGQVETLQTQVSDLMRAITAHRPADGEAAPGPKAAKAKKAE